MPPSPEFFLCLRHKKKPPETVTVLSMPTSDDNLDRKATKIESVIFTALHRAGQVHVAKAIGVSEATVSTAKSTSIPQLARMLAACGLKVVPVEAQCHSPEYIQALRTFARMAMETEPPRLDWDQ